MNTFTLHLQSNTNYEEIFDVISFLGEDPSGKFGILANHTRMMASLAYGLCSYKNIDNEIEYIALPGAILYFVANHLYINTRRYIRSKDYLLLIDILDKELRAEEEKLHVIREKLNNFEKEMLKRLWELRKWKRANE
jgi:F-type H+-transporting ATPase subunit epsilon